MPVFFDRPLLSLFVSIIVTARLDRVAGRGAAGIIVHVIAGTGASAFLTCNRHYGKRKQSDPRTVCHL